VQRRLGLPLTAAVAASASRLSRHGYAFDTMGDVSANDGCAGHQTRHFLILQAIFQAVRSVYGGVAQREPPDHAYSPGKRPDLVITSDEVWAYDLKVFDPLGSNPADVGARGGQVAFGNTLPRARLIVRGLRERPGKGAFRPATGEGHVAEHPGEYAKAIALGTHVNELLIETFGGFSPAMMDLLVACSEKRRDKLTRSEYDETTWSARTWGVFAAQKIAVAVQRAASMEIAHALGLATGVDSRGD